jgi:hypothetical protein
MRIRSLVWLVHVIVGAALLGPTMARVQAASGPPRPFAIAAAGPGEIVSIVHTDIDADGDVDVAALDASLNLILWTNDGSGRFVRARPSRRSGLQTDLPLPGFDEQPASIARLFRGSGSALLPGGRLSSSLPRGQPLARIPVPLAASLAAPRAARAPPSRS